MNLILDIPMGVRLGVLFVLGTWLGSLANLGVYRLAWHSRSIGPWSPPQPNAPPRRWADRLPVVGWLGLRREADLHGSGFWIRPMLLELLLGVGLAALYWWEIGRQGLLPADAPQLRAPGFLAILHAQYAAHLILVMLMLVASVIDVDEKIIPDSITLPGTLVGLLLGAAYPWSLLPEFHGQLPPGFWGVVSPETWPFLQLTSPNAWPGRLDGFPQTFSLVVGLGCWWLWCVALMPRSWYTRHGWRRALKLCLARLLRESATYRILVLGLIGSGAVAAAWFRGEAGWSGLLSALVGVAAGGSVVWMVRIIGTAVLRREAMGFGDVTLMAMIGSFLGWQTCLVIFFLAPLAALVIGVLQLILIRDSEIPYGPFLCLAAVVAIVCWTSIWDRIYDIFAWGWFVPLILLVCMALMAVLLGLWQAIRSLFR